MTNARTVREKNPEGTVVWVKRSVLRYISSEGTKSIPLETGGVLIGYRGLNSDYIITNVVGPGPNAIHSKSFFEPDQKFHEREIERLYELSGCTETYLGDWHTHPNSTPYLSPQDVKTLTRIAIFKKARIANPLMLVVAPPTELYKIWCYQAGQKKTESINKIFTFT